MTVLVNRTPVTGEMSIERGRKQTDVIIFGCSLDHTSNVGRKPISLVLNIQTPHMPIMSDGKAPDLELFLESIEAAIVQAARRCRQANPSPRGSRQKQVILDQLELGIAHASGDGKYRYSLRQLYYAIRPQLLAEFGEEPDYGWFCKVVAYENEQDADLPGMYRDDRAASTIPTWAARFRSARLQSKTTSSRSGSSTRSSTPRRRASSPSCVASSGRNGMIAPC